MKKTMKLVSPLAFGLLSAALSACGNSENSVGSEKLGRLTARLAAPADAKDVASFHFVVVKAGDTCDGAPVAETTAALEEEGLPDSLGGSGQAFADGFMVVPAGDYTVCGHPLQADGSASAECGTAQGSATVLEEVTTEVVIFSQCDGDSNGGIDIVGGLNDSPLLENLTISPSKFLSTCEEATFQVTASDPNGDAIEYAWSVESAPAGSTAEIDGTGASASFSPDVAGDYELKVAVTDANGGSTSLSFPLHVQEADCTTGGTGGTAGAGGAAGESGAAGEAGSGGNAGTGTGTGGNAGTGDAGSAGDAGAGGNAGTGTGTGGGAGTGTAGTAGEAGAAGEAGTGGDAGSAGNSGTGGDGGAAGETGTGGDAGSAGNSGAGGQGGSGDQGGSAGSGGADGGSGGTGDTGCSVRLVR